MSKEILEQLFDSLVKVRLLKLFLRNPNSAFELSEIAKKIKSDLSICRRQINKLESINFINGRIKKKKKNYSVNQDFDFYNELRTLVLKSSPASKKKILRRLKDLGKINLAILSGIFIDADNARVDLLVVGDSIKQKNFLIFLKIWKQK